MRKSNRLKRLNAEGTILSQKRCCGVWRRKKLYLNPLLSLNDLARAAGCNKTYVSTFINSQGKTFYDYVNEYRISEACRIMESSDERLSMSDVATRSGFNSMSSFNRYFSKIKGATPTNYYHRLT